MFSLSCPVWSQGPIWGAPRDPTASHVPPTKRARCGLCKEARASPHNPFSAHTSPDGPALGLQEPPDAGRPGVGVGEGWSSAWLKLLIMVKPGD